MNVKHLGPGGIFVGQPLLEKVVSRCSTIKRGNDVASALKTKGCFKGSSLFGKLINNTLTRL